MSKGMHSQGQFGNQESGGRVVHEEGGGMIKHDVFDLGGINLLVDLGELSVLDRGESLRENVNLEEKEEGSNGEEALIHQTALNAQHRQNQLPSNNPSEDVHNNLHLLTLGTNTNATEAPTSSGNELEEQGSSLAKESGSRKVLENANSTSTSTLRLNNDDNAVDVGARVLEIKAKQLVKEMIKEQLLAAGWTIDQRLRSGRECNIVVYVSLDGKIHWSIISAYNKLIKHYEDGDGEGKVYAPGFQFTPIPEDMTRILTKEKRKSTEDFTHVGGNGGNTFDRVNEKVQREKLGSGAGSMKGKTKRRRPILEEENQDVKSPHRMHKEKKTKEGKKRRAPLVHKAEIESDDSEDDDYYVPYKRKRTMLSWMIDMGTIQEDGKVHYMNPESKCAVLDGKITKDGIRCGCCDEIVTISDFEAHSKSKSSDPLKNIYIDGGVSLLQCMIESWNKQDKAMLNDFHFIDLGSHDPKDNICMVCGYGGKLNRCDSCPSTFHGSCLDSKMISGEWQCIHCICRFCGLVGGNTNQIKNVEDFIEHILFTCRSCGKKFHKKCLQDNAAKTVDAKHAYLCGNKCQELFKRLEMLIGVKHETEDGFSWTFIRRLDINSKASQIKCNSKLAIALSIMKECFLRCNDHRSGIDLIHCALYNCRSNFIRLNCKEFITVILERGDEMICVASIRIHGNEVAEMPFIGTRDMYRRQGMCRRLLNAIESVLSSLNVELLVIPSIEEHTETWTSRFGFEHLEQANKQIIKNVNLLSFANVDLLQKKIPKHNASDEDSSLQRKTDNCDEAAMC